MSHLKKFNDFNNSKLEEGIRDTFTKGLATVALAGALSSAPKLASAKHRKTDKTEQVSKTDNVVTKKGENKYLIKATAKGYDQSFLRSLVTSNAEEIMLNELGEKSLKMSVKIVDYETYQYADGSYEIEANVEIVLL
jgi:hypothetical protein